MYSVVLAAMLTTSPATPQWGHGCWGCRGCWGCSGCWGCWGCWGGGWGGGGWPAYYGWGWPGYYGYYGWGCGGAFGCAGGMYACVGCYGTYGWGTYYAAAAPVLPPARSTEAPRTRENAATAASAPATVVVQAPENARIYVENQRVRLKSDGSFTTPRLEKGSSYVYQIRADAVRDGRTVSDVKNVRVWAGRTSRISFPDLHAAVPEVAERAPGATARITVQLPKDAKLYVNDEWCPLQSASRSFDTPPLDPGREYRYTLKAEVMRDGRARVEKKTVAFRAGQPVTVDFRDLDAVRTAGR